MGNKDKIGGKQIESSINKLKKKNAFDSQEWNNKILLNSGNDVKNSLEIIFNEID